MLGSPFYKQLDSMGCGSTCLRIITRFCGKSYSLQSLRLKAFLTHPGVSMPGRSDEAESTISENILLYLLYHRNNFSHKIPRLATDWLPAGNIYFLFFKDDIGNLMDVVPNSITENNEIIYIIQSPELMKWLATEPQKASDIRARYKWIKTIDEFSNPIKFYIGLMKIP